MEGEIIMKIVSLNNVPKTEVIMDGAKNAFVQRPLSSSDGTPNFSFRVFTVKPGGHTPYHKHPFEHLNYVIEGDGAIVAANGDERPVAKGDFAFVLPDEMHQYKNLSETDNLILICAVPKEFE